MLSLASARPTRVVDIAFSVTHNNSEAQFLNEKQEILSLGLVHVSILLLVFQFRYPAFSQNEPKTLAVPEIL